MAQLHCLLFAADAATRDQLRDAIHRVAHLELVAEVGTEDRLAESLDRGGIDLLVVGLCKGTAELEALERRAESLPALAFAGPLDESGWILRAMRLGAREYLPLPLEPRSLAALAERVALTPRVPRPTPGDGRRAPLVAVLGAKGGLGSTTVACGLAAASAADGCPTALVDLDLQHGDAALHFDLEPRYSLADLAGRDGNVDGAYACSLLTEHPCGVSLLAAPARPEDSERIAPSHVETALSLLQDQRTLVVADLPKTFDETSLRVIAAADLVLLVGDHTLPALAATRRALELLARLQVPREKVRFVLNRQVAGERALEREAESFLGARPDVALPNDYETVLDAVSSGHPVAQSAPNGALARAFVELSRDVRRWCGVPVADVEATPKFNWRSWIRR